MGNQYISAVLVKYPAEIQSPTYRAELKEIQAMAQGLCHRKIQKKPNTIPKRPATNKLQYSYNYWDPITLTHITLMHLLSYNY
jgi:hypothetical protein